MIPRNTLFSKAIARLYCNTASSKLIEWEQIKSKYSEDHLAQILKTLNTGKVNTLKRLGLSKAQINLLQNGSITKNSLISFDDIVTQDIVRVTDLDNICSSLSTKKPSRKKAKGDESLQTTKKKSQNFNQVVGLRIRAGDVSWCHLKLSDCSCNVQSWDCRNFSDLPLQADIAEAIRTGINVAEAIPNADAYIMEKEPTKTGTQPNSSLLRIRMRQEQLISVIMTSLAFRRNLNADSSTGDRLSFLHLMKPHTTAKLFGLFLNGEIVSSNNTAEALLQQQDVGLKNVSSISCSEEIETTYFSNHQQEREKMSRSLLLTIAFLETVALKK